MELGRINRYADASLARQFAEQIAEYEHVSVEQVVLGEILDLLGLFLGSSGGPGGEFLYSTPGYLVYRLLNPLSFVAFKMGRRQGGPSRTGGKRAHI